MKKRKQSFEAQVLADYDRGEFESVRPTKAQIGKYRASARATFIKDRRVNVRLSSPDLMDIQSRAAEEGVPYQTLIASVLHKFVTGRLTEKTSSLATRSSKRATKRSAA